MARHIQARYGLCTFGHLRNFKKYLYKFTIFSVDDVEVDINFRIYVELNSHQGPVSSTAEPRVIIYTYMYATYLTQPGNYSQIVRETEPYGNHFVMTISLLLLNGCSPLSKGA